MKTGSGRNFWRDSTAILVNAAFGVDKTESTAGDTKDSAGVDRLAGFVSNERSFFGCQKKAFDGL
jgi:hypothetical protein